MGSGGGRKRRRMEKWRRVGEREGGIRDNVGLHVDVPVWHTILVDLQHCICHALSQSIEVST